jgi:hypothetical protein
LLSGERTSSHPGGVRLDDSYCLSYLLRRDAKPSTNPTNRRRRGCDIRVSAKIDVKHQSIGTFHKNSLARGDSLVNVDDAVHNKRLQLLGELLKGDKLKSLVDLNEINLVANDFAFRIVFEMSVAFETAFDDFPEFGSKGLFIKQMVYP